MVVKSAAIYHCMSRTVAGEAFFKRREKEMLRRMLAQVADFSGVEVLTYCVMSNHFHVLVRVAPVGALSDTELLRRYQILYPKPNAFQLVTVGEVARILRENGEPAVVLRSQLLARMGDVSQFMKTLKQRFSVWFNKSRDRYGPVWSDRFKSVLVGDQGPALSTVAAYIDLNPVRSGLVEDPKDYRFCGYAEAVAGGSRAVEGIREVVPGMKKLPAVEALVSYREMLFGKGGAPSAGKVALPRGEVLRVLRQEGGQLPLHVLLRCRVRYFTEGAILGSNEFVRSHLDVWQQKRGRKHSPNVRTVFGGEESFSCMNHGRGPVFE